MDSPRPTNDFTELVLHLLGHVRLAGPEDLFDRRLVECVATLASSEHLALLHEDAAVLGGAWAGGRSPRIVAAWPELFPSIAALGQHARSSLSELQGGDVADPALLRRLQALDSAAVELVHASVCALAPSFESWHGAQLLPELREAVDKTCPWFDLAAELLPSLGAQRVELSWSMGAHGRVFASRIVVGAPTRWNGLDPRVPAVLALHEQSVHESGEASYLQAEWAGLIGLARRMRCAPTELREVHADWLASLELAPILGALQALGQIDQATHDDLLHERRRRGERLAALGREFSA